MQKSYYYLFIKSSKFDKNVAPLFVVLLCLLFIFSSSSFAQDSVVVLINPSNYPPIPKYLNLNRPLEGRTGPIVLDSLKPLVFINNVVVNDSMALQEIKNEKFRNKIKKVKYLDKEQAFKKYGIKQENGILLIYTKRERIIQW